MVKERKNNFARIFNRRIFTTTTLSIVLSLIGIWNGLVSVPPGTSKSAKIVHYSAPTPIAARSTPLSHAQQDAIAAESVAQKYMNALLKQNYQQMWSLLHPKVRTKWPNERTFAGFWKARYQDYILYAFTISQPQPLPYCVDPETMIQYNRVEELRVSLELQPRFPSALLPPEDLHPIQVMRNLPFVVQHITGQGGDAWLVLDGGPADLEAPILPPASPTDKTVKVPILMYHYISDVPANDPNPILRRSLSVSPLLFNQQLDYLKQQGYHSITFNQLMSALYYGAPLPAKPIILTFDDGYLDAYTAAYPALKAHGFSGMFYIITGKVGWRGQMTWDQLREMLAHGMQMGSHTVDHPNLSYTLLYSLDQAQQELQEAQQVLQKNLGIVIQHFCYPYGEPFYRGGVIQRRQVMTFLPADGYVDATVAVGVVSGVIQTAQQPFMLPRVPVFGYESIWQFVRSLPW